jgi:hypothetical protein
MVEALVEAGYFDWDEAYDTQIVSDLATVITSLTDNGTTHRIVHYVGDNTAPLALPFLEQWIDEMAHTTLWTGVQPDISGISNGTATPLMTLQQGPNFGSGPVYSVAAYEDGTVVYTGIANVNEIGVHVFQTDAAAITSLAQSAQLSGYFNWQDSCQERIITVKLRSLHRFDGPINSSGLYAMTATQMRRLAWFGSRKISTNL